MWLAGLQSRTVPARIRVDSGGVRDRLEVGRVHAPPSRATGNSLSLPATFAATAVTYLSVALLCYERVRPDGASDHR